MLTPTAEPGRSGELLHRGRLCGSCCAGDRQKAVVAERRANQLGNVRRESTEVERRRDRAKHRRDLAADGVAENLDVARAVGKRTGPRQRGAHGGGDTLARHRQLQPRPRAHWRPRRIQRRRVDHLCNRRDPGYRFLGERSQRVGHGADQLAVEVHRAAAHSGDNACLGKRPTFELREDEIAARSNDVAKHADDVNVEFFDLVALPHGVTRGHHSGFDLINRVVGRSGWKRHNQQRQARKEGEKKSLHVVESIGKSVYL